MDIVYNWSEMGTTTLVTAVVLLFCECLVVVIWKKVLLYVTTAFLVLSSVLFKEPGLTVIVSNVFIAHLFHKHTCN